ncbi:Phosphoglycerate dehydrogenase SerA [Methanonatronarchaeum thermophilum]|uniref:D-3-phosphoglycerate dehydrogenase n=1 Tax=Methanonatronarchaeum thermophilum TaxID=1927129 RepID=A0A1Y3GJ89_9EURY|nr:phosphoglycerate dehydrogenase [Methanonatronarchaeum thermophilum]OUJ19515.1 Phosphoglycerate dehydrogenase SerA [Methanonatronarchaeum thermophilum]
MKILISDRIDDEGVEVLRENADIDIETSLSHEELVEVIGRYDGIIVRSGTTVDEEVLMAGDRLKVVGRAGVGVDNIDVEKATELGIIVINAPEASTISVSEHTMGLLLSAARNIPQANMSMKDGKWEKSRFLGEEVYGKTLGTFGLGRIGAEVAKRAQAFGMNVIAFDPYISQEKAGELGVEITDKNNLLERADFVTFHVPLTDETHHMISTEEFETMKPNSIILNVARGGIIDEKALEKAIKNNKIRGAALDVFEAEPATKSPLLKLDSVITTPHLGASTEEAQENVAISIASHVLEALEGKPVRNALNVPAASSVEIDRIKPYLSLSERMGAFAAHFIEGSVEQIEITFAGNLSKENTEPVKTSALKGYLDTILQDPVNFVNAPVIARNRGIKVIESKTEESGDYNSLLTINITNHNTNIKISGTVFGKEDERVVQIGNYRIETKLTKNMLYTKHTDQPGVIGKVGNLLGQHGINVGSMQLGRLAEGGEAIMIMSIDEKIPQKTLQKLRKIPEIKQTKQITNI